MRAVHVSSQLVVLKGSASALIATVECQFRPRKHLTMLACLLPSCDCGRGSAASRASRTFGLRSRGVGAPPLAACEGHLLTERQAAFCGSLLGRRFGRTLIGHDPAVAAAYWLAWRRARSQDGSAICWRTVSRGSRASNAPASRVRAYTAPSSPVRLRGVYLDARDICVCSPTLRPSSPFSPPLLCHSLLLSLAALPCRDAWSCLLCMSSLCTLGSETSLLEL